MISLVGKKFSARSLGVRGVRLSLALLLNALMLLLLSVSASAQQVRLAQDAHTSSTSPNTVYGAGGTLNVSSIPRGGATQIAYIKFNPAASLPANTTVDDIAKATLRLYVSDASTGGAIQVQRVTGAWSEGAVTYNTRPTLGAVEASGIAVSAARTYIEIDLTQLFKDWMKGAAGGGIDNNGIALVAASTPISVAFDSKENMATSHEPTLSITLVDSKVRADLATEKADRESGDASLQSLLNAEGAARLVADTALQNAINAANAAVNAEAQARQSAVAAESSARQAADQTLQGSINSETTTRQTADASLQTAIDAANSAITAEAQARSAAVAAEAGARQSGDTALQNALNSEITARQTAIAQLQDLVNAAQVAINAEATARQNAVNSLQTSIAGVKAALDTEKAVRQAVDEQLQFALNRETADRAAGDALLRNDLNNETTARQQGQTNVLSQANAHSDAATATEAQARQSADNNLQSQLNTEAASRQANVSTLQSNINTETAARQAAINTVTNSVNGETTRATNAEATLSNNITTLQSGQATLTGNLQSAQNSINALQTYVGGGNDQITNLTNALKSLMDEVVSLRNDSAPIGTIMAFAGPASKIPAGWELCDGRLLTRNATTQALFDAIGVSWGSSDAGVTNFRLPDLRGRFLRGLDSSPNVGDSGRDPYRFSRSANAAGGNTGNNIGSVQFDSTRLPRYSSFSTSTNGFHNHNNGAYNRLMLFDGNGTIAQGTDSASAGTQPNIETQAPIVPAGDHSHSVSGGGDSETAPQNAAVLYLIRVK